MKLKVTASTGKKDKQETEDASPTVASAYQEAEAHPSAEGMADLGEDPAKIKQELTSFFEAI